MTGQILPVLALLAGTAFMLTASGLHGLLLPLRASLEGFSTTEIGLIGTGWATGFVLGCLYAPSLVRRVGHIRAFGAALSGASIVALLNAMLVHPVAWILLRGLSGFLLAGAFMIVESWLNERATNESRGTIFSVYMTVSYTGLMSGQLLAGASASADVVPFMLTAILFSCAVLPTALSTAAAPKPLARVRLDLRRHFSNSPVAFVTVLLVGVINGAFGTLAPVFGAAAGLSPQLIGVMMGITIIAGAVAHLPAGRMSDRTDRRYVLAALALGAAAAGLLIFLLRPESGETLLMLVGAYGALAYPLYSIAVAQANDHAAPEDFVAISGGLLLLYGIGTIVGPLAASGAMSLAGSAALFLVTAAAHVVMALWAVYRTFRRAPVPESLREAYQPSPSPRAMTPQAAALDPRGEAGEETARAEGVLVAGK